MLIPASTASLFERAYPTLNQTAIGLCFLPMAFGAIGSTFTTGKLLDRTYRIERKKWEETPLDSDTRDEKTGKITKLEHTFHIEKVRLKATLGYAAVLLATVASYGWSIAKAPLPVPLILQFISKPIFSIQILVSYGYF